MLPSPRTALDRLRRPEYTGENRCLPCTILNLLLVAALALAAGRVRRSLGALAFAAGVALVGLRGYLISGTPELTERYLPDAVLAAFDTAERPGADTLGPVASPDASRDGTEGGGSDADPDAESESAPADDAPPAHANAPGVDAASGPEVDPETGPDARDETDYDADAPPEHAAAPGADPNSGPDTHADADATAADPVDPERALLDADAVEESDADLVLVEEFESAWLGAARRLRADDDARTAAIADLLGNDAATLEADPFGIRATAGDRTNVWMTEGALLADAAAHRVLRDREPWPAVGVDQRLGLLRALRSFLSTCPICGGDVAMTDDAVESCCRQWDVLAVRCDDCGEHYLELNPEDVGESGRPAGVGPTRG